MSTDRAKVRPRNRATAMVAEEPVRCEAPRQVATPNDSKCPLQVLARLPEVSPAADRTRMPLKLDWLKSLDWKRVRQMNLDPNWVAGGVLALVLLLLLIITLNRNPKPVADTTAQSDAPTWNSAANAAPTSVAETAPNNVASGVANAVVANTTGDSIGHAIEAHAPASPVSSPAPANPVAPGNAAHAAGGSADQFSLEGIFYPRTPHAAPIGMVQQPATQSAAARPSMPSQVQPGFADGIRTAQRDVSPGYRAPATAGPQPSQRAQFDGTIHQP